MPELPEVEVAARNLRRWTKGRKVREVVSTATKIVGRAGRRELPRLAGARFVSVNRVGKNLLITLARGKERVGVWSHLGMTGKWVRRAPGLDVPLYSHASFALDDGKTLHYCDMRQFGHLEVVPGARFDDVPRLAALGPDPLHDGVDATALHARLARVRLPIKVALLDQTLLAGVGNIQSIEACWRAKLDPRRAAKSLTPAEVARLARAILASIEFTLAQFDEEGADKGDGEIVYVEEDRASNPFKVYAREGQPCPRGNGTIERIVQAGRSTFFCPACQAWRA
jgi:formamidopyrimidine-DNA glycosylase